jgi:hypothetical protein
MTGQPPYRMGRRAERGANPVDFLNSICSPEFREIFSLRNPEWLQVVLLFLNARLNSEKYSPLQNPASLQEFCGFFECRRGTAVQLPRANQKPVHLARFVTSSNKTERGRLLQSPPFLRFGSSTCALHAGMLNLVATRAELRLRCKHCCETRKVVKSTEPLRPHRTGSRRTSPALPRLCRPAS